MHRPMLAFTLVVALIVGTLGALAQNGSSEVPPVDQELLQQGQQLYRSSCTICHQLNGSGSPPTFPALAENENLQDVELIVANVHEGRNAMPAFPQFDATQIAALATFIRNTWGNEFGGVEISSVESILAQGGQADTVSIWDGVYTQAQAERGEPLYTRCAQCHGVRRLGQTEPSIPDFMFRAKDTSSEPVFMHVTNPGEFDVGPPLGGRLFFRDWAGSSVGNFYLVASTTMPLDNPGALSDQEYIDIVAFLLASSDVPAGDEELPANVEVLNDIIIEPPPEE